MYTQEAYMICPFWADFLSENMKLNYHILKTEIMPVVGKYLYKTQGFTYLTQYTHYAMATGNLAMQEVRGVRFKSSVY